MSAEKEARVGTAEHVVRNKIKPVLDEALAELSLEFDLERWSYISIIMPKDFVCQIILRWQGFIKKPKF